MAAAGYVLFGGSLKSSAAYSLGAMPNSRRNALAEGVYRRIADQGSNFCDGQVIELQQLLSLLHPQAELILLGR